MRADFEVFRKKAQRLTRAPVMVVSDQRQALEVATNLAGPEGGVCLTGSLYLIGDLLPLLPTSG